MIRTAWAIARMSRLWHRMSTRMSAGVPSMMSGMTHILRHYSMWWPFYRFWIEFWVDEGLVQIDPSKPYSIPILVYRRALHMDIHYADKLLDHDAKQLFCHRYYLLVMVPLERDLKKAWDWLKITSIFDVNDRPVKLKIRFFWVNR